MKKAALVMFILAFACVISQYSGAGTFGSFYAILENRINFSCEKMGLK